jgi:phosphopentomutase
MDVRRVFLIVIDALGVGAMPDAALFGDHSSSNTLGNVARACGGLALPCLGELGLGNITQVEGLEVNSHPTASHGRLLELSHGKDTTTGHWELAGLVLEEPFQVYPEGFPAALMKRFVAETGCGGYLGNKPASGTEIIEELDGAHCSTGHPIIYTSADSVFQVACDIDVVPLEQLYDWCKIARSILDEGYTVSRVIARPYQKVDGKLTRLGGKRHDYSVPPPSGSVLEHLRDSGARVVGVGKIADIFLSQGITHSVHTSGNTDGLKRISELVNCELNIESFALDPTWSGDGNRELVFVNLVDTDMHYGHRNDPKGFGRALEEIDVTLGQIVPSLGDDDLMLIVGDHGCDPTQPGTDHTREMVPLLSYNRNRQGEGVGDKASFTYVARAISDWLEVKPNSDWAH